MTRKQLLKAIQSRAARVAVGPSTVRGSSPGTVAAARGFFRSADLAAFGAGANFARSLNRATEALRLALPQGERRWGLARKLLNIFLRDCLYTTYLNKAFHLQASEAKFELPLDSITAKNLKKAVGRGRLTGWPGVKRVTPEFNEMFQQQASAEAHKRGIARVHLDAIWWSQSRDDAPSPG